MKRHLHRRKHHANEITQKMKEKGITEKEMLDRVRKKMWDKW